MVIRPSSRRSRRGTGRRRRTSSPRSARPRRIFFACAALLDPGTRVLVEKPAYEPLLSCARALGADILRFERRFENRYRIDPDDFEAALPARRSSSS